jgi:hypothetical protein
MSISNFSSPDKSISTFKSSGPSNPEAEERHLKRLRARRKDLDLGVFIGCLRAAYYMGVVELETTDPESDVVCLALSNTLDELASLLSLYDILEAVL